MYALNPFHLVDGRVEVKCVRESSSFSVVYMLHLSLKFLDTLGHGYTVLLLRHCSNDFMCAQRFFLGPVDLLPWHVGRSVRPSVNTSNSAPLFGFFLKLVVIFLGWISLAFFFNLRKFKSSISQYLFGIYFSILAYIFLRVVFMSYKEVCARKWVFWGVRIFFFHRTSLK